MATAPATADGLELHLRHTPGGKFTDTVFGVVEPVLKVRDILRFQGPLGTFFLREDNDRPILIVASGTGFAPVKAMLEHVRGLVHGTGFSRPITLYWGGRRPHDLYMNDRCAAWVDVIPGFSYVPVVSEALQQDGWTGRTGFVHRAAMTDHPDMAAYQVYACGTPAMVDACRRDFIGQCGLPDEEFYADAFTTQADVAAATSAS